MRSSGVGPRPPVVISTLLRFSASRTAASIREAQSVGVAFGLGADICTNPPKVFDNMANHALTDKGLEQFKLDFTG